MQENFMNKVFLSSKSNRSNIIISYKSIELESKDDISYKWWLFMYWNVTVVTIIVLQISKPKNWKHDFQSLHVRMRTSNIG